MFTKPSPTVKQLLTDRLPYLTRPAKQNYVYSLPCSQCPLIYIGQTSRGEARLKDHLRDVTAQKSSSAPYQHFRDTQHQPNHAAYSQVFYEHHYFTRLNLETFTILMLKDKLINQTIPTHYGVQSWIKFLQQNHPIALQRIQRSLQHKAFQLTNST
jgi:hypothetical protein